MPSQLLAGWHSDIPLLAILRIIQIQICQYPYYPGIGFIGNICRLALVLGAKTVVPTINVPPIQFIISVNFGLS